MSTPTRQDTEHPRGGDEAQAGSPAAARSLARFVTAVFGAWSRDGIPFVVLRNHEQLPEQVDNDLDVLVPRGQLRQAEQTLASEARAAGYLLHNRAAFGPLSLFFHNSQTLDQIQVDLFTSLAFRLLHLLPAQEVIARRKVGPLFAVPDPVDEAIINLLTRLLYQGRVKDKYKPAVVEVFRSSPEETRGRLTGIFSSATARFLVEAVQTEDWVAVERRTTSLRRSLFLNHLRGQPWALCRRAVQDAWRLACRWVRTPGLHVAVLGPDGCGKSTVIPRLIEELRFTFSPGKGLLLHWKPVVFGKSHRQSTGIVTDPHGKPPRNPLASLAYFGFHWLEFLLGSVEQVHPVKFRNGLVISDRCYYDFLVDPKRFRLKLPGWFMHLGGRMLPQPDLIFLLDAPAEVLQSRKQEVPLQETERQRQAFLATVNTLPNGHVLDATRPPDEIAANVVRIILCHLTRRRSRRS